MKIFIALFVIFTTVHGASITSDLDGERVRVNRQAYIWNARACDNGKKKFIKTDVKKSWKKVGSFNFKKLSVNSSF